MKRRIPAVQATNEPKPITVTVNISPGLVTPHQRICWKKWWVALIAEVKTKGDKND